MLFLSIKYARPDLANAVGELSRCMNGDGDASYKKISRVMNLL
jgi:hypothetical protein